MNMCKYVCIQTHFLNNPSLTQIILSMIMKMIIIVVYAIAAVVGADDDNDYINYHVIGIVFNDFCSLLLRAFIARKCTHVCTSDFDEIQNVQSH